MKLVHCPRSLGRYIWYSEVPIHRGPPLLHQITVYSIRCSILAPDDRHRHANKGYHIAHTHVWRFEERRCCSVPRSK